MAIKINNPFGEEFWPCFTDIMASLFALFILIFILSLIQQSGLIAKLKIREQELAKTKEQNKRLAEELDDAVRAGFISIEDGHIDIEGSLLFATGSSEVTDQGKNLLKNIAGPIWNYIAGGNDMIMVSGFTDDVNIKNQRFPSNWELSTSRSTEVVKLLIDYGVSPKKIFASGFGEFHPIIINTDDTSRQRNRRVEISRVTVRLPSTGTKWVFFTTEDTKGTEGKMLNG